MTISIELIKADWDKYFRALNRLETIGKKLKRDHPWEAAQEYAVILKHNFISQKYAGMVRPLKAEYKAWKAKKFPGTESKIGILTFSLVSSLQAFQYNRGFYAGVHPQATSDGKGIIASEKITGYGRRFERIRPFFEMSHNDYAANQYPEQGKKAINRIKMAWK